MEAGEMIVQVEVPQSHLQENSRRLKLNRKFIPDIPERPGDRRHALKRLNAVLTRLQLCWMR